MKTRGEVAWSSVTRLDTKFNQWRILLNITKEEGKKLEAVGLKPKKRVIETEDGEDRVVLQIAFSRYLHRKGTGGGTNKPPQVVDSQTNAFTGGIGAGTDCIVKHKPYTWNNKFGKGTSSDLQGVQIIKLVPFDLPDEVEDDDDDGFDIIEEGFVADSGDESPQVSEEPKEDIPY